MTATNRQVLLASRPQGAVTEQNFRIVDAPMPAPADGEVLVKNEWLSLDPYMRGRMSDAKSYVPPAQLDEPMAGQTVGEVLESRDARFKPGDKVLTSLGWQSHGVASAGDLVKVDARRAPASYYLGILGMPGITAWFGLHEIGQPKAGETVRRIGGVGRRGQRRRPAREAARLPRGGHRGRQGEVRLRGAASSASTRASTIAAAISTTTCAPPAPMASTSTSRTSAARCSTPCCRVMNRHSRVVICGLIAEYNATEPYGYRRMRSVLVNRIRMQGMIVFDWKDRYGEAVAGLARPSRRRQAQVSRIDRRWTRQRAAAR